MKSAVEGAALFISPGYVKEKNMKGNNQDLINRGMVAVQVNRVLIKSIKIFVRNSALRISRFKLFQIIKEFFFFGHLLSLFHF